MVHDVFVVAPQLFLLLFMTVLSLLFQLWHGGERAVWVSGSLDTLMRKKLSPANTTHTYLLQVFLRSPTQKVRVLTLRLCLRLVCILRGKEEAGMHHQAGEGAARRRRAEIYRFISHDVRRRFAAFAAPECGPAPSPRPRAARAHGAAAQPSHAAAPSAS